MGVGVEVGCRMAGVRVGDPACDASPVDDGLGISALSRKSFSIESLCLCVWQSQEGQSAFAGIDAPLLMKSWRDFSDSCTFCTIINNTALIVPSDVHA